MGVMEQPRVACKQQNPVARERKEPQEQQELSLHVLAPPCWGGQWAPVGGLQWGRSQAVLTHLAQGKHLQPGLLLCGEHLPCVVWQMYLPCSTSYLSYRLSSCAMKWWGLPWHPLPQHQSTKLTLLVGCQAAGNAPRLPRITTLGSMMLSRDSPSCSWLWPGMAITACSREDQSLGL